MEEVLDVYTAAYDHKRVLVCMDKSNKQHIKEARIPLAMKPGHQRIYDYDHNGVSSICFSHLPRNGAMFK